MSEEEHLNHVPDEPSETPPKKPRIVRIGIGAALGAVGGYAWFHFVGCPTGSCAIQANPVAMTGLGVLMGASFGS